MVISRFLSKLMKEHKYEQHMQLFVRPESYGNKGFLALKTTCARFEVDSVVSPIEEFLEGVKGVAA